MSNNNNYEINKDILFQLNELGLLYRPANTYEEADIKRTFDTMPYPMFRELARHSAKLRKLEATSNIVSACDHCGCVCEGCRNCGGQKMNLALRHHRETILYNREPSIDNDSNRFANNNTNI